MKNKKNIFKMTLYILFPILLIVLTLLLPLVQIDETIMSGWKIFLGVKDVYTTQANNFSLLFLPLGVFVLYKAIKEQPIREVFCFLCYAIGLVIFLFLPINMDKAIVGNFESEILASSYVIVILYLMAIVLTAIDIVQIMNRLKKKLDEQKGENLEQKE